MMWTAGLSAGSVHQVLHGVLGHPVKPGDDGAARPPQYSTSNRAIYEMAS
jgi:hypothetical protein